MSLLATAHACGYVFERLRLPRVGGEITAGLLLGPTLLGRLWPNLQRAVFSAFPDESLLLSALYWMGLILLMFVSGFRMPHELGQQDRRMVTVLAGAALLAPFVIGFVTPGVLDLSVHRGPAASALSFRLVFAIAFAVTSIPVISKILIDLGLIRTRFASIVLTTATIEDIVLWVALAVATKLAVAGTVALAPLAEAATVTLLFLGLSLWLGPRGARRVSRLRLNVVLRASRTGYVIVICFVFAAAAQLLDVNVVFGALVAGIVVATLPDAEFGAVRDRIADVALGVLVPIYFALVGFKLDLVRDLDPVLTLGFLAASSAVKIGCVSVGARLAGARGLIALDFAMAMNARGGPGIVLGSVAYEAGIIGARLFATLITTAVVTSLISGVWLRQAAESRRLYDVSA